MRTLAESQRKQTGTQQEYAGDGHCEKCIGFEFFTHGTIPANTLKTESGAPCKTVSANFKHPCPAMPAVLPAILAIEQGEKLPHRSAPGCLIIALISGVRFTLSSRCAEMVS
jgi:hypothetical protein